MASVKLCENCSSANSPGAMQCRSCGEDLLCVEEVNDDRFADCRWCARPSAKDENVFLCPACGGLLRLPPELSAYRSNSPPVRDALGREVWPLRHAESAQPCLLRVYSREGASPPDPAFAEQCMTAPPEQVERILAWHLDAEPRYLLVERGPEGSLRDLLDERPLGNGERLAVLRQLHRGLAALHRRDAAGLGIDSAQMIVVQSRDPLTVLVPAEQGRVRAGGVVWRKAQYDDWHDLGRLALELCLDRHDGAPAADLRTLECVRDPRWRELCRGLLDQDRIARWKAAEVSAWLEAWSFCFAGQRFDGSSEDLPRLAAALESTGRVPVTRLRSLRDWVTDTLGDGALAGRLDEVLTHQNWGDNSDRLAAFIWRLAPGRPARLSGIPITWEGLIEATVSEVNDAALARLLDGGLLQFVPGGQWRDCASRWAALIDGLVETFRQSREMPPPEALMARVRTRLRRLTLHALLAENALPAVEDWPAWSALGHELGHDPVRPFQLGDARLHDPAEIGHALDVSRHGVRDLAGLAGWLRGEWGDGDLAGTTETILGDRHSEDAFKIWCVAWHLAPARPPLFRGIALSHAGLATALGWSGRASDAAWQNLLDSSLLERGPDAVLAQRARLSRAVIDTLLHAYRDHGGMPSAALTARVRRVVLHGILIGATARPDLQVVREWSAWTDYAREIGLPLPSEAQVQLRGTVERVCTLDALPLDIPFLPLVRSLEEGGTARKALQVLVGFATVCAGAALLPGGWLAFAMLLLVLGGLAAHQAGERIDLEHPWVAAFWPALCYGSHLLGEPGAEIADLAAAGVTLIEQRRNRSCKVGAVRVALRETAPPIDNPPPSVWAYAPPATDTAALGATAGDEVYLVGHWQELGRLFRIDMMLT